MSASNSQLRKPTLTRTLSSWALTDSNCRPLPCKGRGRLLGRANIRCFAGQEPFRRCRSYSMYCPMLSGPRTFCGLIQCTHLFELASVSAAPRAFWTRVLHRQPKSRADETNTRLGAGPPTTMRLGEPSKKTIRKSWMLLPLGKACTGNNTLVQPSLPFPGVGPFLSAAQSKAFRWPSVVVRMR